MPLVQGLLLGASFCCSIGPQSLFVLRQGVRREKAVLVAALCTLADFLLIAVALAGADGIVAVVPNAEVIAAWAGGGFMLLYGCFTLAAVTWKPSSSPELTAVSASLAIAGAALAISLLNPQVYLEVVVIVGLAGLHFPAGERWLFGLGVAVISPLWFFGLVLFGGRLAPFVSRPSVALAIDVVVSVAMIGLGLAILLGQGL